MLRKSKSCEHASHVRLHCMRRMCFAYSRCSLCVCFQRRVTVVIRWAARLIKCPTDWSLASGATGSRRFAGTANSKRQDANSHQIELNVWCLRVYKGLSKNAMRSFVFSLFSPENKKGERGVNLAIVDGNSLIVVGITSLTSILSCNTVTF